MPLLLLLKTAWEWRTQVLAAVIVALLLLLRAEYAEKRAILASRPQEHFESVSSTSRAESRGAVKVTRRFAPPVPGSDCKPALLEVIEERAPVEIATTSEKSVVADKTPARLDSHDPRRIVGVGLDLLDPKHCRSVHAGYSLFGRVDVVYSYSLQGRSVDRHGLSLSYRF